MSQLNILVFNSAGNDGAPSYLDYLGAFAAHSRHKIYYHNFVYEFAPDFDFSIFDVIVITHNFWPEILSGAQREALARAKALKVLFLQDEYQYVRIVNGYMAQMGIDLMFSCVAEKDFDAFYPKALIPSLREVHHVLTGYVPERLIAAQPADDEKIYDVGYRSRASPYYMGELGHEKLVIAKRFQVLCAETGLKCNISLREEDRLKGPMWMRFLRSCRVQLGTPSGSSIVDMDGSVIEAETAYRVAHPHASFEEVHQKILAPHEGKLVIDTVSPRHFEAAAAGSAMAMHEGYYGGILEAGRNYISIRKDYSNISDVLAQIADRKYCEQIAQNAHLDLIASGRFTMKAFIEKFDSIVERHAKARNGSAVPVADFNAAMIGRHNQALFFNKSGAFYVNTRAGLWFRWRKFLSHVLTKAPILGPILQRVGGDPLAKLGKAAAAMRASMSVGAFRKLLLLFVFDKEFRSKTRIEYLLRDILLLCIVRQAQRGVTFRDVGFHTSLVQENGKQVLKAENGKTGKRFSFFPDGGEILLDLSAPYPIHKFGNCTVLTWLVAGRVLRLRSDADEYFHLKSLTALTKTHARDVERALRKTLLT